MSASGGRWRARAPAKVNLGLFVGPLRASDGRHELVSVMQSISLADELTLAPAPAGAAPAGEDLVECPGVPGAEGADNLAAAALRAFRVATGWDAGAQRLRIDKRVPVAAGLAGGSADAAAALRLVHAASGLGDERLLHELARELGADVPAQLAPGRWLARGAGELLERLPAPSEPLALIVLPADPASEGLSTATVYAQADRLADERPRSPADLERLAVALRDALARGPALPAEQELLHNDLQRAAISLCPEIEEAIAAARGAGAERVLVSGSGPTVVALLTPEAGAPPAETVHERLASRVPAPLVATPVQESFARPWRVS